jgi:mRNA interferase MazF
LYLGGADNVLRTEVIPVLSDLLAIPATRTIRGIPTEVPLDESDGMPTDCVITADNIMLIERAFLTRPISQLSDQRMREVCEAIRRAVAC